MKPGETYRTEHVTWPPYSTVFVVQRRHESDRGWWVIWRMEGEVDWRAPAVVWDDVEASGETRLTRIA